MPHTEHPDMRRLFIICIRTNVDYVVVASFVTQAKGTAEALAITRIRNADWHPTNWMVDFSETEINALTLNLLLLKMILILLHNCSVK